MKVGFDPDLEVVGDARSASAWLAGLSPQPAVRLDAIRRLLGLLAQQSTASLGAGQRDFVEALEVVRVEQWRTIVTGLEQLAGRPVPFTPIEWPLLHSALAGLQALRNLYKRIHAQGARAESNADDQANAEAQAHARVGLLSLSRALDAQSRTVALQLTHRCVPQQADWDELCVLARRLRRSAVHDDALPDEVPLVSPATARALFVYPLLLECASLPSRTVAQADLVRRLAARLASRVGYRIDKGAPSDNDHGPRLALTAAHGVRLDTHRVPGMLAKWRGQWFGAGDSSESASVLPLPEAEVARLFDELGRCWAPAPTPRIAGAHPAASAASRPVRLRFGLPAAGMADRRCAGEARMTGAVARSDGDGRYEYGRWEQNTIIRMAFAGAPVEAVETGDWIGPSESATRLVDRPDGVTVIARESAVPRAAPGALVAVEQVDEAAPHARRSVCLGTVEAIEQLPGRESHASRAHWLVVRLWAGEARAVGVRMGDCTAFEDAWLLRGLGASFELPCLVLAPGRARGGDTGVLREASEEVAIRFVSVLDRGIGYERLSMRTESAREAGR
ncbi:MAG: hypothetical protein LT102_15955 [Burkholderiaceae bacterium]|nr:hypothetical protein [Burkholderiaceae bacterium]